MKGNIEINDIKSLNTNAIALWILSKLSIGRSLIPEPPLNILKHSQAIKEIIVSNAEKLLDPVLKEQNKILKDRRYAKVLKSSF